MQYEMTADRLNTRTPLDVDNIVSYSFFWFQYNLARAAAWRP